MEKTVLTIAGSDPSGGAGVQADLQTFAHFGVDGLSAITAITAQNENEVLAIHPTPADILTQQLSTACKGKKLDAVKIGMVATEPNVKALVWFLNHTRAPHVVIDPVLHSSSGTPLLESKAYAIYRQQLLPLATVITPNLFEAGVLAGMQVSTLDTMKKACDAVYHDTNRFRAGMSSELAILIKGGHLEGDAVDVLFDGERYFSFPAKRIPGPSPRGTGCRFSSAIAACLALGDDLQTAIRKAKEYLADYISRINVK